MPPPDTLKPSITAIVLAFDEAVHIERCLTSLWPIVQRIVVVDSGSKDGTPDIARRFGADVLERSWTNHAEQFQWALTAARPQTDWVMRIDCDEYLEEGLRQEIAARLGALPEIVTGIDMRLKLIFRQRFIRWGGYHQTWLRRLWRTGSARIEQRWMDERAVLTHGEAVRFHCGDLVDENLKDIDWWTAKHNRYATLHMIDFISLEYGLTSSEKQPQPNADGRARFKRFLRYRLYGSAPLYWRAVLYFLQRYVLRLGFLDGRQGFVWHFLQGFWLFVLMDAKIDEARTYIRAHGVEAFRRHLQERYGVRV